MNHLTIKIDSTDISQIISALEVRADSWENTAKYMENEANSDPFRVIEECNSCEEAWKIANDFRRIIKQIENQMPE